MLTVEDDAGSVARRLAGGLICCPACGQPLSRWGHARWRKLRGLGTAVAGVRLRRARCRPCRATHVLLPVSLLLRRADTAEVIGAGLVMAAGGAGHRVVAARLGRPASTVRGWLRRFGERAEAVRVFFTRLLADVAPDPVMPAGAAGPAAAAVSAVTGAAVAVAERWPHLGKVPVWRAASAASGGLLIAPGWPPGGRNTN
jgi:transposase-like protein